MSPPHDEGQTGRSRCANNVPGKHKFCCMGTIYRKDVAKYRNSMLQFLSISNAVLRNQS